MKAEILAPAGNEQALDAAFAAGADAVYFGLPLFGARAFAKNFTLDQAGDNIRKAHLAGKKVYVTMNTLIEEDQMEQAYEMARALHEMGVDALIVQDLGLIHLLHHRLPDLELHASTQLSVSTPYQIEQLRKLGISRVVLAREATLDEIRACAATGMELEAFVHGALCISYSGQCRFSQIRYGRSGNKGMCAQPCRMEYTLEENGKPIETEGAYQLSLRDLSLVENVKDLVDAGVYSLKIEGRMKSPEYVYESVQAVARGLDQKPLSQSDLENLQTTFNRGYTRGHAYGKSGLDLVNPKTSNHQGIAIGEVLGGSKERIRIRLDRDLHQGDGLRFGSGADAAGGIANFIYDRKGRLISHAKAGQVVEVGASAYAAPGSEVRRTSSYVLSKEVERAVHDANPQAPVRFVLHADAIGSPLVLKADDGRVRTEVSGPVLDAARTAPTSREQIERSLSKTGNTWAKIEQIDLEIPDHAFLPAKVLNELRRKALEQLEALRLAPAPLNEKPYSFHPEKPEPLEHIVEIMRREQSEPDGLKQVSEFPLPDTIHKASLYEDEGLFSDHLGKGRIVESMNVTNSYALAALLELGYQGAVLSGELSEEGRRDLLAAFRMRYGFDAPVMMTVYEKPRLMLMKHCPVNTALKDGRRKNCSLCRTRRYTLRGKDGRRAVLYGNPDCRMQVFDETPVSDLDRIEELENEGIQAFRLVFTDETPVEVRKIRRDFQNALEEADRNRQQA